MLLLELSGWLFQFEAREPALEPLFQFAPKIGEYPHTTHAQRRFFCQAPTILPTSARWTEATSCW